MSANEFIGPPVSGVLVGAGVAIALGTPAAVWAIAVVILLLLRGQFRIARQGRTTTMRADIAEGLRFLWRNRVLRTMAVMVGVFNFAQNATWALLVLWAVGRSRPCV